MVHAVIMAGGVGTRFWPASRREQPKQFLKVFGERTLIQETVDRIGDLVPPERCYVVTNKRYVDETRAQLPTIPPENVLAEPISRNTAPCINFAAVELARRDPEAMMVVLPADHMIKDDERFRACLRAAIETAREPGALVTIGIQPTHPATGYGYIQFEQSRDESGDNHPAYPVKTFAEKPDIETAERFLYSGDFVWNSGMFVWRVDTVLDNLQRFVPRTYEAFQPLRNLPASADATSVIQAAFETSQSISIDYAIMERADHVYVVPGSFGWSDIGDWRAVYDLSKKDEHGNALDGEVIVQNSSRCLVRATEGRLVVLVGIHDALVIETEDATLVCSRDQSQQVKSVVEYLSAHQLDNYV